MWDGSSKFERRPLPTDGRLSCREPNPDIESFLQVLRTDMDDESLPNPRPDTELASRLFDDLRTSSAAHRGVTRASYGHGEGLAHDIVGREARNMGLTLARDSALNLYATLPGHDSSTPIFIGSHLDSVPCGGNFDGAAGVLMGLAVVAGLRRSGTTPPLDITIMAIRAEESAWFNASFIGSRAAFGLLSSSELDTVFRADNNRLLSDAIDAAGGSAAELRKAIPFLDPASIGMFIEPHIEQGPVLVREGLPFGLATTVRGSIRYREARCLGAYSHSGATPRPDRQDAVEAAARLVVELSGLWDRFAKSGRDLTATVGRFTTANGEAAVSKVAGRVDLAIEMRSASTEVLGDADFELRKICESIGRSSGTTFKLGPQTKTSPAPMHPGVKEVFGEVADRLGIETMMIPCGAAHDASVFQSMGVPTGMILIRNRNGSHNPREEMDLDDFAQAAELLMEMCLSPPDLKAWRTA